MSTVVGRLREDGALGNGIKYVLVSHNTRMGVILFVVYVLFYGGFMALSAFWPEVMSKPCLRRAESVLELIGDTPMVKLPDCCIWRNKKRCAPSWLVAATARSGEASWSTRGSSSATASAPKSRSSR